MQKDPLLSGESKNIEYKVQVPEHSEKYIKTVVAFANGDGGQIVSGVGTARKVSGKSMSVLK